MKNLFISNSCNQELECFDNLYGGLDTACFEILLLPGYSVLRNSIMIDRLIALLKWLYILGKQPWYFSVMLMISIWYRRRDPGPYLGSISFRVRIKLFGIRSDDMVWYTFNSIKRGSVQMYRYLGVHYEKKWIDSNYILKFIQNYCSASNNWQVVDNPRFSSRNVFKPLWNNSRMFSKLFIVN